MALKDVEMVATEDRGGDSLSNEQKSGRIAISTVNRVTVEENNPVRAVVRIDGQLAGVAVAQRLLLYRGVKKIDLENTVDWKQNRFMKIEQLFPYDDPQAQIAMAFPSAPRRAPISFPIRGRISGTRFPGRTGRVAPDSRLDFAGTAQGGVTIAADRQLIILGEGVIRAGMLRGSYSPWASSAPTNPPCASCRRRTRCVPIFVVFRKGDWTAAKFVPHRDGVQLSADSGDRG